MGLIGPWLLYAMAGLCWINDWPWLVAVVGVSWGLDAKQGFIVLLVGISAAFILEAVLARLRPKVRTASLAVDVGLEGAALAGFALLWGALPGVVVWQLMFGADASMRAHRLLAVTGRRVVLRAIRFLAAVLIINVH
jgi:hypothetical protein